MYINVRDVLGKLGQGLGPLRDLNSVFVSEPGARENEEWYPAIENDIKNIPAFTKFFRVNVPITQVMLPARKNSRFSKRTPPGDLKLPRRHRRSSRFG